MIFRPDENLIVQKHKFSSPPDLKQENVGQNGGFIAFVDYKDDNSYKGEDHIGQKMELKCEYKCIVEKKYWILHFLISQNYHKKYGQGIL